jgi:hypothetical protein
MCFMLVSWLYTLRPWDGRDKLLRNVVWLSMDYTALYRRRYTFSKLWPQEPRILHKYDFSRIQSISRLILALFLTNVESCTSGVSWNRDAAIFVFFLLCKNIDWSYRIVAVVSVKANWRSKLFKCRRRLGYTTFYWVHKFLKVFIWSVFS